MGRVLKIRLTCLFCNIVDVRERQLFIINVKKLQFIHVLTAADLRTSKTAIIKKVILLYHCTSSYVNVQQYSKITFFIFAVFDVRRSAAVNMCINCSFFTLIFAVFLLMTSPISCRSISTVNQTFDYLVVNLC